MKYIVSDKTVTIMSAANSPVEYVESGEIIKIKTKDCFSNRLLTEDQTLSSLPWDSVNPCTGPIYVKGAEAGDILKIHILDITLDKHGVLIKDRNDLKKYSIWEEEKSLHVDVYNEEILLTNGIRLPIEPMIGVIGTAPLEDVPTTLPGIHGGNMDSKMIKKGSTVFLPVFYEGALLAIGDLHAGMGDGEAAGCGIEISGDVTIQVELIKGEKFPVPMIGADDMICMIASERTLEQASEKSVKMMLEYMIQNCKQNSDTAWILVSAMGNVRICQFANKLKTVRCEMPKKYLDLEI